MKLKLLLNIGSIDNEKLMLDKTHEGDVVDVDEKRGADMIAKGWAAPPSGKGAQGSPAAADATPDNLGPKDDKGGVAGPARRP